MEKKQKLNLIKSVTDAICDAWENGYYGEFELNSESINSMEIREWLGIFINDNSFPCESEVLDDIIEAVYNMIKNFMYD